MRIIIKQAVYDKVMHWVNKVDFEVSGFGKVVRHIQADGSSVFEILDAHMIKQTGGAAHTDLDDAAIARLMYQTKDTAGELKWWWHSHVKMATFWSGTDTKTIQELGTQGWIIATVFNQKHENKSALCYRTESDFGYSCAILDDMKFEIIKDSTVIDAWDAEFDNAVTKPVVHTASYGGYRQPSMLDNNSRFNDGGDAVTHPPAVRGNEDDYESINMGLLGYGITFEAKKLNMSYADYRAALVKDDPMEIKELVLELSALEKQGQMEGGY